MKFPASYHPENLMMIPPTSYQYGGLGSDNLAGWFGPLYEEGDTPTPLDDVLVLFSPLLRTNPPIS